jgi:hypothetical protein
MHTFLLKWSGINIAGFTLLMGDLHQFIHTSLLDYQAGE